MPPAATRPAIAVNGREASKLTDALLDLTIVDDGQAPSACTARFSNRGRGGRDTTFLFFDLREFDFGSALAVTLGDDTIFTGRVETIDADFITDAGSTISVRSFDRLADLQRSQRSRTFENVTDADLVQRIAGEHGMLANVALTGPAHATVAQLNQTDLEFLRERLRRIDALLWTEDSVIHARPTADRNAGTTSATWGDDLRAFSASADLSGQRTRVQVSGWDVLTKSPIESAADDAVLAAEIGDGRSGASVLSSTLGAHVERIVDSGPATAAIAQAHAAAQFRFRARQFVIVRGESSGGATLRVGGRVAVSGVGELFSGTYYISRVHHRFDLEAGFRTAFTASSARLATGR
jgi:phage protein D